MIGRGYLRQSTGEDERGFDAFEMRLGDMMRGERATLGKSLQDVQRELKIKAAYIAAIENADPSAFDTPGFVAGYVRSYARYLGMDPDWTFETFCAETGFEVPRSMAPTKPVAKSAARTQRDPLASPFGGKTPFLPAPESPFAGIELRAVASIAVLGLILTGLGGAGWFVLREVQKVTLAPVEQAPSVVVDLDPLAGGAAAATSTEAAEELAAAPSPEVLDRLYRPQALDVPVLTRRDGPIAALDPDRVGPDSGADGRPAQTVVADAADNAGVDAAVADALSAANGLPVLASAVQVTTGPAPEVQLVAVRESWVRVKAADGTVIYEGIMAPGATFDLPATEAAATLRTGESGALYMAVNGVPYGPVGPTGSVSNNVALSSEAITATYSVADLSADQALADLVVVASAGPAVATQAATGVEPLAAGSAIAD